MKFKLFYIAFLLTLLSCSNHPGQVMIQGSFAHLEQGEFFIYSPSGGTDRLDTLHIENGEFRYMASIDGEVIFHLMYPNYSELTIFARPGDDIEIVGDAQNLSAVEVKGTEDNETYTEFRKRIKDLSDKEARTVAQQFTLEHPTLALSRYLFSTYFLLNDSVPQVQIKEIFDSLCRACPEDVELSKLSRLVRSHGLLAEGQELPDFKLKTRPSAFSDEKGVEVSTEDFRGNYLLISFWASWKSGSQSALYRTRRFRREMREKGIRVNALSYSLDAESSELARVEKNDSVDYYSYCDFQCFNSPLVQKWGICDLPFFVLVDANLKIVAFGTDWQRDIEPHISKLCL
jgi:hypothetical protein